MADEDIYTEKFLRQAEAAARAGMPFQPLTTIAEDGRIDIADGPKIPSALYESIRRRG